MRVRDEQLLVATGTADSPEGRVDSTARTAEGVPREQDGLTAETVDYS